MKCFAIWDMDNKRYVTRGQYDWNKELITFIYLEGAKRFCKIEGIEQFTPKPFHI